MEREFYMLLTVLIAATAAYISARVTSKSHIKIAEYNSEKELKMQENLINDERVKSEISLERAKLEELHLIYSEIKLENSQTISYIQSSNHMTVMEYRERYIENCKRLHLAEAITALYYPEMIDKTKEIYGQTNLFWASQEGVLRTDIKENESLWQDHLSKAMEASKEISSRANNLQYDITERGKILTNTITSNVM